jgi:MFS family permease
MEDKNLQRNVLIVCLIALVNMLGYGIIIPLVYAYSKKFGLSDFENGLLFAMYALCQFISTPIIGRLSDRFGRRPMLILSIVGTALSFFMMAFAPSAIFLFLARALDGLTAGNIPVIFAVISDSTKHEERAAAFGKIGSAFSLGFIFGPLIAGLTVNIWAPLPFIIAGVITVVAAILTFFYLPETNPHIGTVRDEKLFDFPMMWRTLFDPRVGVTFVITLIFYLAFACAIIYGFQPFTFKVLGISPDQNAILFGIFGLMGLISQTFLVGRIAKSLGMKKAFSAGIFFTAVSFMIMGFSPNVFVFAAAMILLSLFNSVVQTLIPTLLSQEADEKSQGAIMGLNASYQSIGMIFGPLLGGAVAAIAVPLPFVAGSLLVLICFILSLNVLRLKINENVDL